MKELLDIGEECIRCGICEKQQGIEDMPQIMCGDLAEELEAAHDISEVSPQAYEFLFACSLCDACTTNCPQLISCSSLVKAGREKLLELQPEIALDYRSYRVDYRENVFSVLRSVSEITYEDTLDSPLSDHDDSISLFFPGCSLSTYSEILTKTTYELLLNQGVVQGMSVYCCGKPLGEIGVREAHQTYGDSLIERLRQHKVTSLVIACPNCYYAINELLDSRAVEDITIKALPQVLEEIDFVFTEGEYASITVHDSCPDRYDQLFAKATRALLMRSGMDIIEMENHGLNTICCGAGGLAHTGNYSLSIKRCERRLSQFAKTKAESLICSCMGCVNTFLSDNTTPRTHHYLELILDTAIDWHAVQCAFDKMCIEAEEVFTLPLSESTRVFDE